MTDEPPLSLDAFQRWMQKVIMHPGGVVAGAETVEAGLAIESVVTRSRALSSFERLDIYNRSYFARLLECMQAEYSVLATAIGEELFDSFALGYLQQHPSQSYTLAELGERFPDYLAATRPVDGGVGDEGDWPEFLIDLARLERTINVVFDGPGTEGESLLDRERLMAIQPDHWAESRLECVPCLKLLPLSYPINDYFTAVRRGDQPDLPARAPAWLAITRRDFRVYRYPLVATQFHLLHALLNGETVGSAIEQAAATSPVPEDQFAADLRDWFFQWTTAGFFRDVRLTDRGHDG
jgi:hypothetical protein